MSSEAHALQMFVAGLVAGGLMQHSEGVLSARISVDTDSVGNYEPVIRVIGKETGTTLKISVEVEE